jgi:LDH2 family malate/lactate/ureidoglycolate dehydrogenase
MSAELLDIDQIRTFAKTVLVRAGMSVDDAEIVADALVWADLRGITSQGVAKLAIIARRLRDGGNKARPQVSIVVDTPAMVLFDADDEWGHVSGVRAMRAAMARAKEVGAGVALVRNTSSASAMGYYVSLAVAEGLVGFALNNGTPLLRPWGGTTKLLGNQAFAIGCPAGRNEPLIFDTALSAITLTGIDAYRDRGEQLPPGVALDEDDQPTTDPEKALVGTLLPVGGHRGYGLALLFEVLTGVLSGGPRFAERITPITDTATPQSVSHFMFAIDPSGWLPGDQLRSRVDALIDSIHDTPPAHGVERVRVPGEHSTQVAADRARTGVPIPPARLDELRALADEFAVAW